MSGESKQGSRDRSPARRPAARRARLVRYAWVAVVLAGGGGVAWAAEEVVVKAKTAEVMSTKSGLSSSVATLNQNDKVTVVGREANGWMRVRASNGKEGFIKEAALTSTALTAGGRPLGSAESTGGSAGNAARGLEPGAEQYVRDKQISPQTRSDVQRQIDLRKAMEEQPAGFVKFQRDGNVGSGR